MLVVDEHLAEPGFRGLYEATVTFGRPPTAFDVVPYSVRVGDIDERVLFIKRANVKTLVEIGLWGRRAETGQDAAVKRNVPLCTIAKARLGYAMRLRGRGFRPQRK